MSYCGFAAPAGDNIRRPSTAGLPGQGVDSDYSVVTGSYRLNVKAFIEPDVDHDNFGDESQDRCTGQTATGDVCSGAFSIKAKGGKKSARVTVTLPGAGELTAGDANDPELGNVATKKKPLLKSISRTRSETTKGLITFKVKLNSAGRALLNASGIVKARIKVLYEPKFNVSSTSPSHTAKVKLKD